MDFVSMYGFPVWMLVALFCLVLGTYLTSRRKKAKAGQVISGLRRRSRQQEALRLCPPGLPRLPLLKFCPACGKQTGAGRAGTCGFCGQTVTHVSRRRQTRRLSIRLMDTTG